MQDPTSTIQQYHLHKSHPEKLQFEIYSLGDYCQQHAEKTIVPHSHSYYQIIWFFEDGGVHTVDFQEYAVKKNTVLFIAKDQIHAFDTNIVSGWLIHFNESFFMHTDVDIFLKYNIFRSHQTPCYTIDNTTADIAASYIQVIQQELLQRHAFGCEDIIRFSLKSLLIYFERTHKNDIEKKLQLHNQYALQFYQFKELVETYYTQGYSVKDYADLLHISSKTLATITNNIINKPPSQIIADRIILEARRLLVFTPLQIGEIAFKVGFDDASYFVKYFKRFVGVSPRTFRNNATTTSKSPSM